MSYIEIASEKRARRDALFKKEWLVPKDQLPDESVKDVLKFPVESGFLTPSEIEITESSALTILENIKTKQWSAFKVASAFGHRATIAHQLVNCLTEIFFDEGLKTAKELDEYYEKTGKLKGPLHGLPISLKDNINIKGQATSLGFVGFANNPPAFETESVITTTLRSLGAVFYVKTNVPVSMMMPESINHLYGNTVNPLNRNLTSGGSSGGEAALLALKGSPIGVGSDIGGSIRIPSSFQTLYALKPAFGRLPTYGTRSALPGFESITGVSGPLTTSLESLEFYTKTIIDTEPWLKDPKVIDLPWKDVELLKSLNFAILKDDGGCLPYPATLRGLNLIESKLKEQGHTIIEWDPKHHKRLTEIIGLFFVSDGGEHVKEYLNLSGEPVFPFMKPYIESKDMYVSKLWDLQSERQALAKAYLDSWNETALKTSNGKPIDAIIMPTSPYSGVANGNFTYFAYTGVFNVLDYTVGIIPVTRADKSIDVLDERYSNPRSEVEKRHFESFNPEQIDGGAVGVQIVGKRLQEEKVLKMMKVVTKAIGTDKYWE